MEIDESWKDESRKVFEAYRDEHNARLESEGHKPGSKWHVTQAHYQTWQAARESLVIVLPDTVTLFDPVACEMVDAIHAAGVKTK